ncbi:MAG: Crp/Fnr family transcriptional regulator [Candidatus Eremiobacteraeota bacterium]|nr:Crp/Fnr family transcriptional regulator [Candidatus Eremiobacteraeota bacterium]
MKKAQTELATGDTELGNKVWYLRQNRLFEAASDQAVFSYEHLFRVALFPKRSMVFDHGDPTRTVYLIKRGKIRISRLTADGKEVTVALLAAGDLFGEESLFASAPRTTVATCIEETLLCVAKADDMLALLSQDSSLALNVAKVLSNRLTDASAAMEDLAYARVSDRIMHLLVRLANEHGTRREDGILLDVRLTHSDIASLVGSTRETVSLELSNLVRAGRICGDARSIVVPFCEFAHETGANARC